MSESALTTVCSATFIQQPDGKHVGHRLSYPRRLVGVGQLVGPTLSEIKMASATLGASKASFERLSHYLRSRSDRRLLVHLHFSGYKLGDDLLALPLLASLQQLVAGHTGSPEVTVSGPLTNCITTLLSLQEFPTSRNSTEVPGTKPDIALCSRVGTVGSCAECSAAAVVIRPDCDAAIRVFADTHVADALPERYHLALEVLAGVRLSDTVRSAWRTKAGKDTGRLVCLVTATSRRDKNYGENPWRAVALQLPDTEPIDIRVLAGFKAEDRSIDLLMSYMQELRQAALVLGNDTGILHLAALSQDAPVIGLHNRHSPGKWSTGLNHQYGLATSAAMCRLISDTCPVRDGLDETDDLANLAPAVVAQHVTDVLRLR